MNRLTWSNKFEAGEYFRGTLIRRPPFPRLPDCIESKQKTTMASHHRAKRLSKATAVATAVAGTPTAQPTPTLNVNNPRDSTSLTTNNNDPPSPWRNSTAKKLLHDDILAGRTKDKSAKSVFRSRPEFQRYKLSRFITNFKNLEEALNARKKSAEDTKAAYEHDLPILQRQRDQAFHYDGSDLQKQLRLDVQQGKTDGMKPQKVRGSRPIYRQSDLSVRAFAGFLWTERNRHERNLQSKEYNMRMKFVKAQVDA